MANINIDCSSPEWREYERLFKAINKAHDEAVRRLGSPTNAREYREYQHALDYLCLVYQENCNAAWVESGMEAATATGRAA